jgi:hypothetical protein
MRRFLASLISNSNKSIQTKGIGEFATYLIFSVLLTLNMLAILLLILDRQILLKAKASDSIFWIFTLCSTLFFFILLIALHPWKKTLNVSVNKRDEKKYGWIFFGYASFTCALLIIAIEHSNIR